MGGVRGTLAWILVGKVECPVPAFVADLLAITPVLLGFDPLEGDDQDFGDGGSQLVQGQNGTEGVMGDVKRGQDILEIAEKGEIGISPQDQEDDQQGGHGHEAGEGAALAGQKPGSRQIKSRQAQEQLDQGNGRKAAKFLEELLIVDRHKVTSLFLDTKKRKPRVQACVFVVWFSMNSPIIPEKTSHFVS